AAEAGGVPRPASRRQGSTDAAALSTSSVELERPTRHDESSARFLTRWDSWIRLAHFGELLLAVLTLIYIHNPSARTNSHRLIYDNVEEFPGHLDVEQRSPARRENFTAKKDTTQTHASYDSRGLTILREVLRDISFRLAGRSFKVDIRGDAVWVRMVQARHAT